MHVLSRSLGARRATRLRSPPRPPPRRRGISAGARRHGSAELVPARPRHHRRCARKEAAGCAKKRARRAPGAVSSTRAGRTPLQLGGFAGSARAGAWPRHRHPAPADRLDASLQRAKVGEQRLHLGQLDVAHQRSLPSTWATSATSKQRSAWRIASTSRTRRENNCRPSPDWRRTPAPRCRPPPAGSSLRWIGDLGGLSRRRSGTARGRTFGSIMQNR